MSFSNACGIVSCHHKVIWQSQDMSRASTSRILGTSCHDPHACLEGIFFHHMYSTYCIFYHCLLQSTVLYVHTSAHAKGILFVPKASSSILRSESVQIKPLQRLPTVCAISLTPRSKPHIGPTLVPQPVLHLILVNFADNLVHLCFLPFKSVFEKIWVGNLDWWYALNLCLRATKIHCQTEVYGIIFSNHTTHKPLALTIRTSKTNLLTCYTFTIPETCNLPRHNL